MNRIIQKANSYLLKNTDISFEHCLVGSGSRGLVTRIVGGNQGYDLDFNLVLDAPKGFINNAELVKRSMMDAFQYAVKGTGWSDPKDSTSVMTIKVVDKKNKRIQYGCDLAIVYYDFRGEMYYLHNYKDYRGYQFVRKSNARDIDSSVDTICDYYENGWNKNVVLYNFSK